MATLRLFREVWTKDECEGYDITEVKIQGSPRFQRELVAGDCTKAQRWFIYELAISATGRGNFKISEEGAPYFLEITNGLLWNPGNKTCSVDQRRFVYQTAVPAGLRQVNRGSENAPRRLRFGTRIIATIRRGVRTVPELLPGHGLHSNRTGCCFPGFLNVPAREKKGGQGCRVRRCPSPE